MVCSSICNTGEAACQGARARCLHHTADVKPDQGQCTVEHPQLISPQTAKLSYALKLQSWHGRPIFILFLYIAHGPWVLYALPSLAVKAARLGPSYFPSTATRNWFAPEPVDGCTHVYIYTWSSRGNVVLSLKIYVTQEVCEVWKIMYCMSLHHYFTITFFSAKCM